MAIEASPLFFNFPFPLPSMAKPKKKTPEPSDDVGMNRDLIDEEGIEPETGAMDSDRESTFAASEAATKKKRKK